MENIFLAEPSPEYQKSFENYALAYQKINDQHYFRKYQKALEDFHGYLIDLSNLSTGTNLPHGKVKTSTFWLVHQQEVVGVVRIRDQEVDCAGHIGYDISPDYRNQGYGQQVLKLALEKAATMGKAEVILTCNIDNVPSKKIIENNNGKLLATVYDEEDDEHLYKFAISLK